MRLPLRFRLTKSLENELSKLKSSQELLNKLVASGKIKDSPALKLVAVGGVDIQGELDWRRRNPGLFKQLFWLRKWGQRK